MNRLINVRYIDLDKVPSNYESQLADSLPNQDKSEILKHVKSNDRLQKICGKLILQKMLIDGGYTSDVLHQIKVDQFNRPYIDRLVDFNISHSDKLVVVALSRSTKIGIDVERIQEINLNDFTYSFTNEEIIKIKNNPDSIQSFYDLWTKKEAVIKANGKGLHLSMQDVVKFDKFYLCEGIYWKTLPLALHHKYACAIAYVGKSIIQSAELNLTFYNHQFVMEAIQVSQIVA